MKLIAVTIGIGLAAWALSRVASRPAQRSRNRETSREAVTRWEGEGGAIPQVEARSSLPQGERAVAS